ncbi:sugar transferase [Schaalia vaccimaxillae]|uniref:sugar transferase n=1 Tax=Schaalia vaccimaxillae TaxID=183916 RepID=UPI0003B444F8|nr:sugar transferase [Schaalia vaccimaxillae]
MSVSTKPLTTTAALPSHRDYAGAAGVLITKVVKRLFDVVASSIAIIILTPVWLILWLLVRSGDSGPAFFTQQRVGLHGQHFTMYKFRTMCINAEKLKASLAQANNADTSVGNAIMFKMEDDPRITPIGKILRKLSLDELPQLFNVLKGDMSLVGPRPPLPSEVAQYEPKVLGKFQVKPGITGLWQVSGRSNLSWEESVELDLHYANNLSLGLDAWILWRTVPALLRQEGAC